MSKLEIPLLRESEAFVNRLTEAAKWFGDSKSKYYHRVNWSHRYEDDFYEAEVGHFCANPDDYITGHARVAPALADVFSKKLGYRTVSRVLIKAGAHLAFRVIGKLRDAIVDSRVEQIYRKCYVDDIELVFDPDQAATVRAVYPYPLSLRRQMRFLHHLLNKQYPFKLAGIPYCIRDLIFFALYREVGYLQRLETRAQIRHARELSLSCFKQIQLSEEFEIGSLDFVRALRHSKVEVINSAHGVGKYLPIHAYSTFFILTKRQVEYYRPINSCNYIVRKLNLRSPIKDEPAKITAITKTVVFLSQKFNKSNQVIIDAETEIIDRLRCEFGAEQWVRLLYKPHPTSANLPAPRGFQSLGDLGSVNGFDETIFVSMFSTCQIDPNFVGRKLLVRTNLIRPEIAFDDTEEIVEINKLIQVIRSLNPGLTIANYSTSATL